MMGSQVDQQFSAHQNFSQPSHSPIDLTSSPPQPIIPPRMFGKDVTNSALLRQLDDVMTKTQVREYTTEINPAPSAESSSRKLPIDEMSKVSGKVRREWERTRLEKDLATYSFKRPACKIWSMRKSMKEIDSERAELHWVVFKGKSTNARIAVSPAHSPTLHICKTVKESDECLLKIQSGEMLSFDMEWEKNFVTNHAKKTGIVQLASATDIYVLQLSVMKTLPMELLRILKDSSILKCGVAIKQDAAKFRSDFDEEVQGCLELSSVAKYADPERWKNHVGMIALRDLSRVYLRRKLNKNFDVRVGKWNNPSLDERQCEYAANDVYVGVELIHTLAGMIGNIDPFKEGKNLFQSNQFREVLYKLKVVPDPDKVSNDRAKHKENVKNSKPISIKPSWKDDESDFESISSELTKTVKGKPESIPVPKSKKPISEVGEISSDPASRPKSRPLVKNTQIAHSRSEAAQNVFQKQAVLTSAKRKIPTEQNSPKKGSTIPNLKIHKMDKINTQKSAMQYWQEGLTFAEIADQFRTPAYAISTVAGYVLKSLDAKEVSLNKTERERLRIELQPDQLKYARRAYHTYLVGQNVLLFGSGAAAKRSSERKKTKSERRPSVTSSDEGNQFLSLNEL